jgi:hypothetical protein
MIIGLDFDNTMVDYHALFHRLAVERGLISPTAQVDKTAIRDHIRATSGDGAWQQLQGAAYGPRIGEAIPAEGLLKFLRACRIAKAAVYVVSHKTTFANRDFSGVNLREAAIGWMKAHGLFHAETGLSPNRVFFEETRGTKIARIAALQCDVFVDDLLETLMDPSFPEDTRRVLFSNRQDVPCQPAFSVAPSFDALQELLFPSIRLREHICAELLGEPVRLSEPLHGGRNSLVYLVPLSDGSQRVAKFYFRSADDPRNRLATEYESLSWLWQFGVRQIPQPLAADPAHDCGIYAYVEGQDISPEAITPELVDQTVVFLGQLHDARRHAAAAQFGPASEACFSVEAIAQNVRQRLKPFQSLSSSTAELRSGKSLVNDRLVPALTQLDERARALCESHDLPYGAELPEMRRTLSPSDFGFHNARLTPNGKLVFLDFEYFGWDDPAKLLADFLLHPAMSLSSTLKRRFVSGALSVLGDDGFLRHRLLAVYPLFALKWCTIILNEFLPHHRARRDFAGAASTTCLQTQLERAEAMLQRAIHARPFDEE